MQEWHQFLRKVAFPQKGKGPSLHKFVKNIFKTMIVVAVAKLYGSWLIKHFKFLILRREATGQAEAPLYEKQE